MRAAAIAAAAIALGALPVGSARAESVDLRDWYRRAEALVRSLAGEAPAADREVIVPPGNNIDPKMAHVPPQPQGTMRIIIPPAETGRRP